MNIEKPMETPLDAIILENARSCNLRCQACPTTHASGYPAGFMTMEAFHRIAEHISPAIFAKCGLTGWGETFLDPTYFDKLSLLKRQGYYVGCTSNATLLDRDLVRRLTAEGLDLLCLSIDLFHLQAGRNAPSQFAEHLRSVLEPLTAGPASLTLGMNVVVSRSGRDFLFELFKLLDGLPFAHVSVIPLIMIPTRELHSELMSAAEMTELQERCTAAWPQKNINFGYLDPPPSGNCRSDVHRNVYVGYDGEVSPCCTLAMEFPNFCFGGSPHRTRKLQFGNLTEKPFVEIWRSERYRSFRRQFRTGSVPEICNCCNAWRPLPNKPSHDAD